MHDPKRERHGVDDLQRMVLLKDCCMYITGSRSLHYMDLRGPNFIINVSEATLRIA